MGRGRVSCRSLVLCQRVAAADGKHSGRNNYLAYGGGRAPSSPRYDQEVGLGSLSTFEKETENGVRFDFQLHADAC